MSEQHLVKAALEYLQLRGCVVWRQNQGGMKASYRGKQRFIRFSHQAGISDIIGWTPTGKFLACEAKVGRNKPTESQQAFIDAVNESGGVGVVFWSLDDLEEKLEGRV